MYIRFCFVFFPLTFTNFTNSVTFLNFNQRAKTVSAGDISLIQMRLRREFIPYPGISLTAGMSQHRNGWG